jgi:hypothetical protein
MHFVSFYLQDSDVGKMHNLILGIVYEEVINHILACEYQVVNFEVCILYFCVMFLLLPGPCSTFHILLIAA